MSEKTKKLFIASIITYFLPLIAAAAFWVFLFVSYWGSATFFISLFVGGAPMIPGIILYLIVPLYKRHYYKTTDNEKERKLAIITTSIECGVPVLLEIICIISLIWFFSASTPIFLLLKVIYIISLLPFLTINTAFWRSFPKEEKKEA